MRSKKLNFQTAWEADMGKSYLHGSENGIQMTETGGVKVRVFLGFVRFDTYFNAVSIEKWKYYTELKQLAFCFEATGNFLLNGRGMRGRKRMQR